MSTGDWDGVAAMVDSAYRWEDRRPLMQFEIVGAEEHVQALKAFGSMDDVTQEVVPVAFRGEHLVLVEQNYEMDGLEVRMLCVHEVTPARRVLGGATFDPGDREGAFAELDRRYIEGDGAPFGSMLAAGLDFSRALNRRDWSRVRELMAPDCVVRMHGIDVTYLEYHVPDEWITWYKGLIDLAPDSRDEALAILAIDDGRVLGSVRSSGTSVDGVYVESEGLLLAEVKNDILQGLDYYFGSELEQARARFAEIGNLA